LAITIILEHSYIHSDLPPVEHLDFPLVFSLDGDRGKEQEKYVMTLCALKRGPRQFINWIT